MSKINLNYKKIWWVVLFIAIIGIIWWVKFTLSPIQKDIKEIYNRYSSYLDTQWNGKGWKYEVPSSDYNEVGMKSEDSIRLQATLATFYRFRTDLTAQNKIHRALTYTLIDLSSKQSNYIIKQDKKISTRSFNEAIGAWLALQLLQNNKSIFSSIEQNTITKNIKDMYPWILQASDTENRALLSAAYSLAILQHPLMNFSVTENKLHIDLIRKKVDLGLQSVGEDGVYREGKNKKFTPHYHLVTANMLAYLGEALPDQIYLTKAKSMLQILESELAEKELAKNIELVRPRGVGLQNILLKTIGQKYQENNNWFKYWNMARQGFGFIDPSNSNRLVWRDQLDGTYNDDYSLANMAELFWDKLNK